MGCRGPRPPYVSRVTPEHRATVVHDDFAAFIITPPLKGLGGTAELVRNLVRHDPEVLDMLDQALQRKHGGDHSSEKSKFDNGQLAPGNSEAAARRLHSQRFDLHKKVLKGDLSAHRASVVAGFRHPTLTVRADDIESAVAVLLKHYTREQLLRALNSHLGHRRAGQRTDTTATSGGNATDGQVKHPHSCLGCVFSLFTSNAGFTPSALVRSDSRTRSCCATAARMPMMAGPKTPSKSTYVAPKPMPDLPCGSPIETLVDP